jgi:hypothetical protein
MYAPPVLDGSGWARPPLCKKAITRPKSVNVDQEIMKIGIICSNLIEEPPLQHIFSYLVLVAFVEGDYSQEYKWARLMFS